MKQLLEDLTPSVKKLGTLIAQDFFGLVNKIELHLYAF